LGNTQDSKKIWNQLRKVHRDEEVKKQMKEIFNRDEPNLMRQLDALDLKDALSKTVEDHLIQWDQLVLPIQDMKSSEEHDTDVKVKFVHFLQKQLLRFYACINLDAQTDMVHKLVVQQRKPEGIVFLKQNEAFIFYSHFGLDQESYINNCEALSYQGLDRRGKTITAAA